MKAITKILATLMCLMLVFGCVYMTAFAAEAATGSITVQNQSGTNATVAGKTLNLFKIFDATKSGENVSYQWIKDENGNNLYESFFFGTNGVTGEESGTIHDVVAYIESLEANSFDFSQMAAKLHEFIHDEGIDADKTSGIIASNVTSYTFSELSLGYYLIYDVTEFSDSDTTPAVRSAAMLAHPGENKTINLKADRPHIEKHVDDSDNSTADYKLGTTASIGEIVDFRIVTVVPNHDLYGNQYKFIITDKMDDGLKLVGDITVKGYNPDDNSNVALDYTIAKTGLAANEDFKITFNDITNTPIDTYIVVTYKAEVLTTAALNNVNTATLTYSNDPHKSTSTGSTSASASVFLWQFVITKHMESAEGVPSFIRLAGAQFEVYSKDDLNNPLKFTTSTIEKNGLTYTQYTFDPTAGTVTTLDTVNTGDDGKANIGYTLGGSLGQVYIYGLGEGSYVIRETKAPDGYQIAKGDFEFTVSDIIGPTGAIADAVITEATRADRPGQFTRVNIDESAQAFYVGITNAPGSALPETGGMGTTLFTVIGIIMMVGAAAFFTSRKRSSVA